MTWQIDLLEQLKADEGFRAKPYKCTANKLTIGYGRNLDDVGISKGEAEYLLSKDADNAILEARKIFSKFDSFSPNRKSAIANMIFNLGKTRFLGFKKMIDAINVGNWNVAANEAQNSVWYKQVKGRAERICNNLRKG